MAFQSVGRRLISVTPSDSADVADAPALIYVGGDGNVSVIADDDSEAVTFVGLTAGMFIPVEVRRVMATDTTATNLVAIYG